MLKVQRFIYVFVNLDKPFDSVPGKMLKCAEEEMNTTRFFRTVMSHYEGAKTRARVDSELSEEFEVKVGMNQGSMLSTLFLHL